MELEIRCPHCNRCVGKTYSTDPENSVLKVFKIPIGTSNPKERIFHSTCQRCKKEIYILMGFRN